MTPGKLRNAARRQDITARILSDGCRDYFVEIARDARRSVLRNRWRRPLKFKSLAEAHQMLARHHVQDIRLVSRVADEEAGQPQGGGWGFAELHVRAATNRQQA